MPNIGLTLLGIGFLSMMPETPRFLVTQQKANEAKEALKKIAKFNGISAEVVDKIELLVPMERPKQSDELKSVKISPKLKELWTEPTLRNNLIGSAMVWSMCLFNLYVLVFFVKYFPGDIYVNSLTFAFTDMIAFFSSGVLLSRWNFIRVYKVAFLISTVGIVLLLAIPFVMSVSNAYAAIPLVCLTRMGVIIAFNVNYISVGRLFPSKYLSSVYSAVNLFAHCAACLAPLVAEIPGPIPQVALICATALSAISLKSMQELEAG